jgi:hypothetical protein
VPAAHDPDVGRISSTLAVTVRHHGPDHPRVHELRAELHAAHIKALVDSAPPLSADQRTRLAVLLLTPPSAGAA